jgi:hypothetical protein
MVGSVIVHIMTPQLRRYYQLEKRWSKSEVFYAILTESPLFVLIIVFTVGVRC